MQANDKSAQLDCSVLPAGVTSIKLMEIRDDQMMAIAEVNPYVAVTIKYGQLGDRAVDKGAFGGRTSFSSRISTEQAKRGIANVESLEKGRERFVNAAVIVEDSISLAENGQILRTFQTAYANADGRQNLYPPIVVALEPSRLEKDKTFTGLTVEYHDAVSFYVDHDAPVTSVLGVSPK